MLGYLKGLKKSVFIMFLFAELKKLAIFAVRFTGVLISDEIKRRMLSIRRRGG